MLTLAQIAQALGGRISGDQVVAPGPGHRAVDNSMTVKLSSTAEDGFVVYSHAGDDVNECRDYVRAKLGLPPWYPKRKRNGHADLRVVKPANAICGSADATTTPSTPKEPAPVPRVVTTYAYVSADGEVLYEVQRLEPKAFRQRRPIPGGYSYTLGEVQPVLYRLPDLMTFPHATVFLVEGEKDADRLCTLGITSTTISGSTTWTPELAEPLRGRDVIILADNDEIGTTKAEKAALALHQIAASVRLVLLPGLPEKGDVSDWLGAGHSREELEQVCLAAAVWQPQAPEAASLNEWDAGEDGAPIPPRGWLLGNAFCRRFMSSIIAEGGTGKTALRLTQLLSLAIGRPLTGEYVFVRCRVLIISLEDDAHELRRRVRAACLQHGVDRVDLRGWLYLASLRASDGKLMVLDERTRPVAGPLAAKLAHTIEGRRIDIVSIDPFIKAHALEENSNSAIDQVVQMLANMADQFDIAIDVPHHAAKGAPDPGNANRGRGASAMKDAARLVYTLTPMSPEEAQALGLSEIDRRRLIRLDSAKVNIAPPLGDARWFQLVGVNIGNGTDLYPHGDEVQTVVPWTPPDTFAGLSNVVLNEILTDIEAGLPDGNRYTDGPNVTDRAAWRVIVKHCPAKSEAAARRIIKTWAMSGLLISRPYRNPGTSKTVNGFWIEAAKRPS
jgi:hypothetical protein